MRTHFPHFHSLGTERVRADTAPGRSPVGQCRANNSTCHPEILPPPLLLLHTYTHCKVTRTSNSFSMGQGPGLSIARGGNKSWGDKDEVVMDII